MILVHVYKRDRDDEFVHPVIFGRVEAEASYYAMNNNNNGKKVLQLPPGFKFEPTDEEVVFEYLKSKVFCLPPPPYSLISDVEPYLLYHSHPSTLLFPPHPQGVDNEDQEGYFFCKRSSEYDGNFCNGWNWKVGGDDDDEQILPTTGRAGDMMIGMKRTLVLHRGNIAMTTPHWVMHQYHLLPAPTSYYPNYHHQFNTQLLHQNEWVLCHVFQKKQSSSRVDQQQSLSMQYRHQNYNDYDDDDDDDDDGSDDNLSSSSYPPTSRCSSAVTDEDDEEDEVVSRW